MQTFLATFSIERFLVIERSAGCASIRSVRSISQPSVLGQGATWNGLSGPRHRRHVSVGLAAKCRSLGA